MFAYGELRHLSSRLLASRKSVKGHFAHFPELSVWLPENWYYYLDGDVTSISPRMGAPKGIDDALAKGQVDYPAWEDLL